MNETKTMKHQTIEEVTKISPSAHLFLGNDHSHSKSQRTPQSKKGATPNDSPSPKTQLEQPKTREFPDN